jgi:outer membrane immunogenic protein
MSARPALAAIAAALSGFVGAMSLAQADGMPRGRITAPYAEPTYQPYDWSGFYLGGHLGGANVATDWTINTREQVDQSSTGFAGGAQLGLQKQLDKVVLGVEVSYTWLDAEESSGSAIFTGATRSSDVTDLFTVTGRLGFAYENMLAYAKGGYASADVELRSATPVAALSFSTSERENGWIAGFGLDYGLTSSISIGVEYDYIRFNVGGTTIGTNTISDADVDIQSITGHLNFKFGSR